jgi:hypothetical protein
MTNNKQKTAVEWLQSIELERDLTLADWALAKEMDKEQKINDFKHSQVLHAIGDETRAEQYYYEIYGGGDQ